jgi:hypothetical protein
MTTMRERRCVHCGDVYVYYPSGPPPDADRLNDADHCPTCREVILEALKAIPTKRERVWIECTLAYETLKQWEFEWGEVRHAQAEAAAKEGKLHIPCRRLHIPLFDLESGAVQRAESVAGREEFEGRSFRYVYWTDEREPPRVEEEMERTIATGKTRPWKDYYL